MAVDSVAHVLTVCTAGYYSFYSVRRQTLYRGLSVNYKIKKGDVVYKFR